MLHALIQRAVAGGYDFVSFGNAVYGIAEQTNTTSSHVIADAFKLYAEDMAEIIVSSRQIEKEYHSAVEEKRDYTCM